MREVVLDTETTGLDPDSGHRIVEIGCVELNNHVPTGRTYQAYVNPERSMPSGAFEVHGLSDEFLAQHPIFAEVVGDFLAFIGESPLVIHNASFDLGFVNAELARLDRSPIGSGRGIDTVSLARKKFPGAPANLDALCRRFNVDSTARTRHGALLDAELLAEVYLELVGGRQPDLALAARVEAAAEAETVRIDRSPRPHVASDAERAAHEALLETLTEPIWRK